MSEICYNKLPDGSFRRLDQLNGSGLNGSGATNAVDGNNSSNQNHKVRNQMIKFLKRSKSHTPATIKEMQRVKEKERERMQAVANGPNRKVVVTMMEGGGLPIVATSKAPKPIRDKAQALKEQNRNSTKVCFLMLFYTYLRRLKICE